MDMYRSCDISDTFLMKHIFIKKLYNSSKWGSINLIIYITLEYFINLRNFHSHSSICLSVQIQFCNLIMMVGSFSLPYLYEYHILKY